MNLPPWGLMLDQSEDGDLRLPTCPKPPRLAEFKLTRDQAIRSPPYIPDSNGVTLLTDPPTRFEFHARFGVVVFPGGYTFGPRAALHIGRLICRLAYDAEAQGGRERRFYKVPTDDTS